MAQNKEEVLPPEAVTTEKSQIALSEEQTLEFWQTHHIFQKTLKKNEGNKEFVFYDGPPFATGKPHYGHILPGTIKDVIPRFQTMRGNYVRRRWGWDCHGLPIENLIEKQLGLSTKKDIENYGIEKFNQAARNAVFMFVDEWKKIIPRTGRFVDMDHAYITMHPSYTESVWWSFKTLSEKGLVYEGYKVMPYCPRCGTTLSNFEVNQGYKDITDISAYVKFAVKDRPNTFFLAWTTTPWTLPGNVALAVHPDLDYVEISIENTHYILAKSRLSIVKDAYLVTKEYKGKELLGLAYLPPFGYYLNEDFKNKAQAWKVYGAAFVTADDGTGIVHIAPAFGGDDYDLSIKENLPVIQHVGSNGAFKNEVTDFALQFAKPKDDHQKTDIEIIKYLAHNGLLFAKEKLVHSYPHCWRCDTPLLNYATSSWFVKVTALKDDLVSENKKVNWNPETIRDGRFGKWLEGAKDWAVSRSRYWGAPLPAWKCKDCHHVKIVGSIRELKTSQKERNTFFMMRHGEAENNVLNIMSSNNLTAHHLSEKGKVQAKASAEKLKGKGIEFIYASPFARTEETAEIVRETLGLPVSALILDEHLHEISAGEFDGKSVEEYHAFFANEHERFTKRPEGGETYADVKRRMAKFVSKLNKKHDQKKMLIVSHDSPLWLLNAGIEGLNEHETLKLRSDSKFFLENAEVRELSVVHLPHNENFELDLHRPYIDEVKLDCVCGKEMHRVTEVFDTWYDSGSVPFASNHYPFEHKNIFDPHSVPLLKKALGFPADFIAEGLDQTRGWFYTLLVLGVGLFGKAPFKNVIVNGLLLAEDGRKMAKKLNNYPEISYVINKYGADALRYYLMSSPAVHAEDVRFFEKGVDEVYKKNILRLDNVCSFYEMYKGEIGDADTQVALSENVLDRWIIVRVNETIAAMTEALLAYQIDRGAWPIEQFIDDISTWYLRRSRDRLKSESGTDRVDALRTMRHVLTEFSKAIAPYMPFIAEQVYRRMGGPKESVHLEDWPEAGEIDTNVIQKMATVRKLVTLALEARSASGIKVRQPLSKLHVKDASLDVGFLDLIKEEVNVKEVVRGASGQEEEVKLDTTLTEELKLEGAYRDLLRGIQELRKKENLVPNDRVLLVVETDERGTSLVKRYSAELLRIAGLSKIDFGSVENGEEIKLEGMMMKVKIVK